MRPHTIGIMTTNAAGYTPFPEANFYLALSKQGAKEKFKVYVFFPESVSLLRRKISGFHWVDGQWLKATFPFPDVVYDRVFYNSSYYKKNKAIVHSFKSMVNFLNRGLPSKWELFQQLSSDERLRPHLPQQELYSHANQLHQLLHRQKSIIIKPVAGGFGRGVFHLINGEPAVLEGRNINNQFFRKNFPSTTEAIEYLATKLNRRFLLQRYLELNTPDGYPFDVRVFVQKDEHGDWKVIGKGIRMGPKNKLTSNIHGGGQAIHYHSFIKHHYVDQYDQIDAFVEKIGKLVPEVLEQRYHPLFELGIDVGIDRDGNVWVIEANAKPGRKIFELMGDISASQKAITGPLNYARHVLEREQGGSQ